MKRKTHGTGTYGAMKGRPFVSFFVGDDIHTLVATQNGHRFTSGKCAACAWQSDTGDIVVDFMRAHGKNI